jgi:ferritin
MSVDTTKTNKLMNSKLKPLISEQTEKSLNNLIKVELTASHIYKYFSAYCDKCGYLGAMKWFRCQADEETEHAERVIDYVNDRNGCVIMPILTDVKSEYKSLGELLYATMEQELKVENEWKEFAKATFSVDITTFTFAQWYLNEQISEIATVGDLIAAYESMISNEAVAIHHIDDLMGA